ncbi:hypothetical protein B0T26DRAFT_736294 [Lasiosphaeria miniovina]|uniref:Uncharacterized protein n=1 Tax=Lasiosphaeria miniovina TaxID=1954250 RepID=A0AA40BFP5_9PEZI|nr:uncharacterized protein B0T26DRAFT_736294 [Lasiosphaeria miniovina]KAK0733346.1 hypothetical protein B0T26DRAFT_736294 [Lasiosphaeria miniovina]
MPRFPAAFSRRKSTADNLDNAQANEPSFRVLERPDVAGGKSFDGAVRLTTKTHTFPKTNVPPRTNRPALNIKDNIFADLKSNRGSGSSNTTKTTLTDNSSRHSNTSTTPSSADLGGQEEWRNIQKRGGPTEMPLPPIPPIPKSSSNGFLRAAGRTFSFGGQKKNLPPVPVAEDSRPSSPIAPEAQQTPAPGRSRATTSSTATTVTPPRVDGDFDLDLGGDFGKMLLGNDKRASVLTLKNDQNGRQAVGARNLTTTRLSQPSPIQIDKTTKVEPSPYSWSSHHSNEQLLVPASPSDSPPTHEGIPPPVPRHSSPLAGKLLGPSASPEGFLNKPFPGRQSPNIEHGGGNDEEAKLLRDSLSTVTRFMSGASSAGVAATSSTSRYRRNGDFTTATTTDVSKDEDEGLFDSSQIYSLKSASRYTLRKSASPQNTKVMTPAQFERYREDRERQDKERQFDTASNTRGNEEDEDDNYEDDEDDLEKAKQQAKQRRKQEAHMSVYRQQMMKVTGESANPSQSRPSLQISFSTPNLPNLNPGISPVANPSDVSDEDEEVPLAILAAHGFPGKNRPPTRLSTMMSNPNLRASQQPSYQRPGSAVGEASGQTNLRLPAFARNLPQDPFLGAGLVRNTVRESFALGGGSTTSGQPGTPVPPGGLVGVIASEERSRAMRRGSPHIDTQNPVSAATPGFDPIAGIPPHMLYQGNPGPMMATSGDQAQMQMTQQMQQMQQFMQMQMQFMQMMANQNGNAQNFQMAAQPMSNMGSPGGFPGMGGMPPTLGIPEIPGMGGPEMRHSFMGHDSMLDLPSARGDAQMRTMSMVQPSSASWIQPMQNSGFAPSIRIHGAGYAPSIAPSERSNVGLPGRYRPVSQAPPPQPVGFAHLRKVSTMSGALQPGISVSKSGNTSDDDDEEGWEAMKAKREKKKSMWRTKKNIGSEISALIS